MMFSRASNTLRRGLLRSTNVSRPQQARQMGGGGHFMQVSEQHTWWGEAFGVVCWLWVFHRARNDLPVLLGWRHPWEHDHDDDHHHAPHLAPDQQKQVWDDFSSKAMIQKEVDDDDEEEDDEDDDE